MTTEGYVGSNFNRLCTPKFLVTIIETFRCIECFVRRAAGGSFAKAARCMSDTRCGVKNVAKQEVSVSYRGNSSKKWHGSSCEDSRPGRF